ncbi:glycoside hydrolase family 18 protein [Streptomyces albipurpureus]|uniref:chitinase n=1 Tax=Streptomyces albipurpureus TaxID=2897419 RepID=A0ABT0UH78_9ACTN|nr:glycoside hydrolase family 18 protein [Streptomyces sp. CWNU-1]MCM2387531.1 glycoside hydrolase family 18 protein [Streptomyces sp. CWNU-1]
MRSHLAHGPRFRVTAVLTGLAVLLGLMTGLAGSAQADDSYHPGAPTPVAITDHTVTVTWTPPTANVDILHYQMVKNSSIVVGTTTDTTFTFTGLLANRLYSFAAVAVSRDGRSWTSNHTRVTTTGTTPPMPRPPVVMGVFTEKGSHERGFHVKELVTGGSAAKLTHLTYGYGKVDGGQCRVADEHAALQRGFTAGNSVSGQADTTNQPLRGYLNQLRDLKAKYPQLKLLWSFGGAEPASSWAAARQNPAAFAASCARLVNDTRWAGLFDGVDLALEFNSCYNAACSPTGPTTLEPLTRELRSALGNGKLLTATISRRGDAEESYTASDLPAAAAHVDWYNVQSYDYYRPLDNLWAQIPTPSAPFVAWDIWEWGSDLTYDVWSLTGEAIHPNKLVMGIPTHAWGWKGVITWPWHPRLTAAGPADGASGPGLDDYRNIKPRCAPTGERGKTAVAHCGTEYWTYDTPATITGKAAHLKENGMGGAFLSNLRGDTAGGELLTALTSALNN